MKAFKRDGGLFALLKLTLPRILSDDGTVSKFNAFYQSLAEDYLSEVESIKYSGGAEGLPIKITVDYSVITEEYLKVHPKYKKQSGKLVIIKRTAQIKSKNEHRHAEYIDLYDFSNDLFVK